MVDSQVLVLPFVYGSISFLQPYPMFGKGPLFKADILAWEAYQLTKQTKDTKRKEQKEQNQTIKGKGKQNIQQKFNYLSYSETQFVNIRTSHQTSRNANSNATCYAKFL